MPTLIVMNNSGCKAVSVEIETYSLPREQKELYNEFLATRELNPEPYSVSLVTKHTERVIHSGRERDTLFTLTSRHSDNHFYGSFDVVTQAQYESYLEMLNEEAAMHKAWMAFQEDRNTAVAE